MLKFNLIITFLLSVLTSQTSVPFELILRTRLVNDDRAMVNIQITNLMNKPLDYVEGFVVVKDYNKNLVDEKRLVLIYGYEPPLQKEVFPPLEAYHLRNQKIINQTPMNF